MRKLATAILLPSVLIAGLLAASSLYAQGDRRPSGSMMGHGMMGDNSTKGDGEMMGDMMGMMKMMSQTTDHCSNMMSDGRPNDQWRRNSPSAPEKKG